MISHLLSTKLFLTGYSIKYVVEKIPLQLAAPNDSLSTIGF